VSIAAPRYAAGTYHRVGRGARIATIVTREIAARAGAGTWIVVAFAYLTNVLVLLFHVVLFPVGAVGLSAFSSPYGGTLWPLELLLVTAATGAGSIAEDLSSRSITLYLSRPIHLIDYLGGKAAGLGFWVAMVAIGPGVVAAILAAALGGISASLAISAIGATLALGLLATAFFTGLALALSAWTARALYAGVAVFGLILSLEFSVLAIAGTTGNPQVVYLSVFDNLQNIAYYLFHSPGITSTYPGVSALYVGAVSALLFVATWMRLARVEVVGE
jgi:ABC-type transport system involved in multi-copper enzyme maturation permease subunit